MTKNKNNFNFLAKEFLKNTLLVEQENKKRDAKKKEIKSNMNDQEALEKICNELNEI